MDILSIIKSEIKLLDLSISDTKKEIANNKKSGNVKANRQLKSYIEMYQSQLYELYRLLELSGIDRKIINEV